MATNTPARENRRTGAWIGGALLIVIGAGALASNLGAAELFGKSIPLAIGVVFLVAYAVSRQYGFLVPGAIVSGVGAGVLLADLAGASQPDSYIVMAGGLGFLTIFAVDVLTTRSARRWWPVVPGGIMLAAGTGIAAQDNSALQALAVWSPVLLIVLGVIVLLAARRRPAS